MTYALVSAIVIAVVAAVSAALLLRLRARTARGVVRKSLAVMGATVLIVSIFTAVFDSLMIAAGLFTYAPEHLLGARIGLAPFEDFSYVVVAGLLLPALWLWLRARTVHPNAAPGDATEQPVKDS